MTIDLRGLKKWVKENYPQNHPLQVIQNEPDQIPNLDEYLAKGQVWCQLAKIK